jgi:hypothetical protein
LAVKVVIIALIKRLFLGKICIVRPSSFEREESYHGALAQLVRAPALQAGGPGFESLMLHQVVLPRFLVPQPGVAVDAVIGACSSVG